MKKILLTLFVCLTLTSCQLIMVEEEALIVGKVDTELTSGLYKYTIRLYNPSGKYGSVITYYCEDKDTFYAEPGDTIKLVNISKERTK